MYGSCPRFVCCYYNFGCDDDEIANFHFNMIHALLHFYFTSTLNSLASFGLTTERVDHSTRRMDAERLTVSSRCGDFAAVNELTWVSSCGMDC